MQARKRPKRFTWKATSCARNLGSLMRSGRFLEKEKDITLSILLHGEFIHGEDLQWAIKSMKVTRVNS